MAATRELKTKVDYIQQRHAKLLEMLKTSNTAVNQSFKDLRKSKWS